MQALRKVLKTKRILVFALCALVLLPVSYESEASAARRLLSSLNNIRKRIHSNSMKILQNPKSLLNPLALAMVDVYVETSPIQLNQNLSLAETIRLGETAGGEALGRQVKVGR